MAKPETIIRELLELAEIQLNGSQPWEPQVQDERVFARILRDGSLGLGEAYILGWWECEALDRFFCRVLQAKLSEKIKNDRKLLFRTIREKLFNRQSPARAFEVGRRHYDLGNDLYHAMLDQRLNYSCAVWIDACDLNAAQEAKLELVCRKIGIHPGMRILELGCGWGGFARYAAEKYGASVLGVTVSKEQVALGTRLCQGLPVELRLQDYRGVSGKYDAVISIELLEHVGTKNYATYMQVVERCLKPDGIAFIQTSGGNASISSGEAWTDKYIFPNGVLPSMAQLSQAFEGCWVVEDWQNMGPDYDPTLMAWHANFEKAWSELRQLYDEHFYRMWRYYLLFSAGGYRARHTQSWQIVLTRRGKT